MVKMETDTLSTYEQTQDKHVLDDSMEINIPRNEINDSNESKEIHIENTQPNLKENLTNDTETYRANSESSENKENENDGERYIANNDDTQQEEDSDNSEADDERNDIKKDIENEQISSTDRALNGKNTEMEIGLSNHQESLLCKEIVNEERHISSNENIATEQSDFTSDCNSVDGSSTEIVNHEKSASEESDNEEIPKKSTFEKEKENDDKGREETESEEDEDCSAKKEHNIEIDDNEETSKKSTVEDQDKVELPMEDTIGEQCSLLKETLTKGRPENDEQSKEGGENGMEDIDMDEDFDPSLLCPDIAMEVDEAPVITSNEIPPSDGNKSPLLYDPIFSTYVDEMTGAEVSFNLSVEEHKLRQETYGEANPVQYTKVHCTACNVHLGSALDGQSNRFVHPLLKVLICKDCYHFYTSGEFEKDEDGSELYCRWCGQGGQVICCTSCEMVFCKKCIRINFGRKKLLEIRDSDDWLCFRCDASQLTLLRIHCAEFMEYVRREISRAATLENATSFMTTDYTHCCMSQKKKYVDPHPGEPKKKRRRTVQDPDYDPMKDRSLSPQPSASIASTSAIVDTGAQKLVPILPKIITSTATPIIVGQIRPANSVFRVGNTTFRPRSTTFSQPRPRVQVINPGTSIRQQAAGPGYIKIMPGGIRVPPSVRTPNAQTFSPRQPSFQHRPTRAAGSTQLKHEWFEKTVRAAARVNSNLSYTLTQLNRAQASATSVEALAVVHNKLQEILSTSINSLIQIRKNLRTEFIAGIKNIRFPPKAAQPKASTSSQDDDVIFVSPTTSSVPPPLIQATPCTVSPLTSINLPPSVSLTKRVPSATSTVSSASKSNTSNGGDKPKVFLRVKSLTALQSVPSECITIPDDPLPPPPLTPLNQLNEITIIDNSPEKGKTSDVETADKTSDVETVDKTSDVQTVDKTSDVETVEKTSDVEAVDKTSDVETVDKTSDVEAVDKTSDVEAEDKTINLDGNEEVLEVSSSTTGSTEKVTEKPPEDVIPVNGTNTANGDNKAENSEFDAAAGEEESSEEEEKEDSDSAVAFNADNTPSDELSRLFNVKIHITRSDEIEKRVKQFGLVNGDSSE